MTGFDKSPNLLNLPETNHAVEYSVEREDIVLSLKNLLTNRSAWGLAKPNHPYAADGVDISVVMIDPNDEEIVSKLRYSQTYIEPDHTRKDGLENIIGQPLNTVSDLITIKDRDGKVVERLYPLILEEVKDENGQLVFMPADGNHRLYDNLIDPDIPFCAVIISNIHKKNLPNYWPIKLNKIVEKPVPLDINERRKLKPGFNAFNYKLDRPNFTTLGSGETVNPIPEVIVSASKHQLIERPIIPPEIVIKEIRVRFADKLAPLPLDSALEIHDNSSSINGCKAVHKIDNRIGVVEFSTQTPDGTAGRVFLSARNQREYLAHATRATALVAAKDAEKINQSYKSSEVLTNEFRLVNKSDLLTKLGIQGSSNSDAPIVTKTEIKEISGCPFSFLVMELDNGQQVSVKLKTAGVQNEELHHIRNELGRVIYSYDLSNAIGLKILKTTRSDKVPTGYQELIKKTRGPRANPLRRTLYRLGTNHRSEVAFYELDDIAPLDNPTISEVIDTDHSCTTIYPRSETFTVIEGRFYDSTTTACAIIGQLICGTVAYSSKDTRHVLLQRKYDPFMGEILTIPMIPLEYKGKSQPKFSDPSESLNIEYSNLVSAKTILQNSDNIVAVPIPTIIEMIKQCQLDVDTIAHLGTILEINKVLRYHTNFNYEYAKLMYNSSM